MVSLQATSARAVSRGKTWYSLKRGGKIMSSVKSPACVPMTSFSCSGVRSRVRLGSKL